MVVAHCYIADIVGKGLWGLPWDVFRSVFLAGFGPEEEADPASWHHTVKFATPVEAVEAAKKSLADAARAAACLSRAPAPLFFFFDIAEPYPGKPEVSAEWSVWEAFEPEALHASSRFLSALRLSTDVAATARKLSSPEGVYRLAAESALAETLANLRRSRFPEEGGAEVPCFYCGMTQHAPPACPSRQLRMEHHGLSALDRLPFHLIEAIFPSFPLSLETCAARLAEEDHGTPWREDSETLVFLAYFDVNRIYQLRYLQHTGLQARPRWLGIDRPGQEGAKHIPLFRLAVDCLRIGDYARARRTVGEMGRDSAGELFRAALCRSFLSLETGSLAEMSAHLEEALATSIAQEETLYVHLLLSRCFALLKKGDLALRHAREAISIRNYCLEARYRRLQLLATADPKVWPADELARICTEDWQYSAVALLDPELARVAATVEKTLFSLYLKTARQARAGLEALRKTEGEALAWHGAAGAAELERLVGQRRDLETGYASGSYVGVAGAAAEAPALAERFARSETEFLENAGSEVRALAAEVEAFPPSAEREGSLFAQKLARAEALLTLLAPVRKGGQRPDSRASVSGPLQELGGLVRELGALRAGGKASGLRGFFRRLRGRDDS